MINNYTLDTEFIDYSFLKMYKLPDLTKYKTFKLIYFVKSGNLYIFKKE